MGSSLRPGRFALRSARRRGALLLALCAAASGCTAVRFNARERLESPAMRAEPGPLRAELRGHVLAPREGAVGGFSPVGAGGCGCH